MYGSFRPTFYLCTNDQILIKNVQSSGSSLLFVTILDKIDIPQSTGYLQLDLNQLNIWYPKYFIKLQLF